MKKKRGGRRREEEEEENSRYEPPLNIETRFATVYHYDVVILVYEGPSY